MEGLQEMRLPVMAAGSCRQEVEHFPQPAVPAAPIKYARSWEKGDLLK